MMTRKDMSSAFDLKFRIGNIARIYNRYQTRIEDIIKCLNTTEYIRYSHGINKQKSTKRKNSFTL